MSGTFWKRMEHDFHRVMRDLPRPVAPMPSPVCPQRPIPDDRSDFTRDSEATGA